MMNSTFTNNSVLVGIIFASLFSCLLFSSCQKEELIEVDSDQELNDIQLEYEALYEFESHQTDKDDNSKSGKRLRSLFKDRTYKVNWNKAIRYRFNDKQIVEFPIQYKKDLVFAPIGTSVSQVNQKFHSLHRLVVVIEEKGTRQYFIYSLFNDENYLVKHNRFIRNNNWSEKAEAFSGSEFIYSISDEFFDGFVYSNGKRVGKYETNYEKNSSKSGDCYIIDGTEYTRDCIEWYVNGNYVDTTCGEWYETGFYSYTICPFSDSGSSGGGGSSSGNASASHIPLENDTITICKTSINPNANNINTLYIAQFRFTSTIGLLLHTTCFHNVSVEIPISTHSEPDVFGGNPVQVYPNVHDIPSLVTDALNITLTRIRNALEGIDRCDQRSQIINNELVEELRNQYYNHYGLSPYAYPFLFNGIRTNIKNGSQWLYDELPWNFVTIDFSGNGGCNN